MHIISAIVFGALGGAALVGVILVATGTIGLGTISDSVWPQDAEESQAGPPRADPVPVDTAVAEARTADETFRTSAEVVAQDRVVLTSEVSGVVEDIPVDDGVRVAAGDTVVRFDDAEERAALASAHAQLVETRAALERAERLAQNDFATQARIDEARAAYEAAVAEVARAERALEDRIVKVPFAGRIGFLEVSPGAYVEPGDPIASLVTDRDLRVRFAVPQAFAGQVVDGTPLRIYPPGRQEPLAGALVVVAPLADPDTRSVAAEARIPDGADTPPGAFVTVEVVLQTRKDAMFVPETALVRDGDRAFVYKVGEANNAKRVEVTVRSRRDGRVEVEGPIVAGDRVVTQGVQKVRDGAAVSAREASEGAAGEASR